MYSNISLELHWDPMAILATPCYVALSLSMSVRFVCLYSLRFEFQHTKIQQICFSKGITTENYAYLLYLMYNNNSYKCYIWEASHHCNATLMGELYWNRKSAHTHRIWCAVCVCVSWRWRVQHTAQSTLTQFRLSSGPQIVTNSWMVLLFACCKYQKSIVAVTLVMAVMVNNRFE